MRGPQPDYDPNKDSNIYLCAPHTGAGLDLTVTAPIDASLKVLPTGDQADDSVLKLQASLAAATQSHDPLLNLKQVREDPELAKKAAEMFEKDRMRTARKREAAEDRLLMRRDRVLGRSGHGGIGRAGLSVAGLEDDEGMPAARARKAANLRRKKANRRGDIYSEDEDDTMPRGRTREDEYDREDDFLADSEEEPEVYDDAEGEEVEPEEDDDPDVDDLEIVGRKTVLDERKRGGERRVDREGTPKRSADDDAVERTGSPQVRKKRRVIDDDEEDE